jgi:4'-phosphopantetheinyl transferase EntD
LDEPQHILLWKKLLFKTQSVYFAAKTAWSLAIAARSSRCFAIGIDLESLQRIKGPDISHLICRNAELDWVYGGGHFHERLAMIFSAKEALYKALYPIFRRYIDFMEVELTWSPEQGCFQAQLLTARANEFPDDRPVKVYCRRHESFFFSLVFHKRA